MKRIDWSRLQSSVKLEIRDGKPVCEECGEQPKACGFVRGVRTWACSCEPSRPKGNGSTLTGGYMPARLDRTNATLLLRMGDALRERIGSARTVELVGTTYDSIRSALPPRSSDWEQIMAATLALAYALDGVLEDFDDEIDDEEDGLWRDCFEVVEADRK